jgi:probable HAF family extracellular repeat protein
MPRHVSTIRSCYAAALVLLMTGGAGAAAATSGQSAAAAPGQLAAAAPGQVDATTARDLGTLGGSTSRAVAVNARGTVVGTAETASGAEHAFVWDRRTGMRDLGTLGGARSTATAVSDNGSVTGTAQTSSGAEHAFVWNGRAAMRDLGTLGGTHSTATAINERGAVVGAATNVRGESRAFLWSARRGLRDVGGSLSSTSVAVDLDHRGDVLGQYLDASSVARAFFAPRRSAPRDLGDLGARYHTVPVALNERGQAVGRSWVTGGGSFHAFVWNRRTGVMTDLGVGVHPSQSCTFSQPVAINDHGVVVGARVDDDGQNFCSGVVWDTRRQRVTDVPFDPTDVSERGLVVGSSPSTWGDGPGTAPMVPDDHAFCRSPRTGRTRDLGPGSAAAANRVGDVVGAAPAPGGARHAALWRCRSGR